MVSDLTVQISNYHANATDIAYRTLRNKQLLKECQELFELVKALQNAVADDIKQINTVIEKLEKGMQVDQEDIAKLKASNDPIKSNLPQLQTSLASHGVISSPSDLLTEILDEGERKELELYLNRPLFERTKWTKGDYLAVAACVLVGLALEILNAAWRVNSPIDTDGTLRKWFNERLHVHEPNNPIDYQGPGFGGAGHRVRSPGHDLFRFLEAIRQTMEGEFKGTVWLNEKPITIISQVNQYGNKYPSMDLFAAFINVSVHLFADFFSAHSLPLPLSSVVYENCSREMRIFVHDLYENGFSLRHITLNALAVFLAYLTIEVWLWMQYGNQKKKEPMVQLKKYEMRTAVTGILSGANIAGCALFSNPFLINIPVLMATVDSSLKLMLLKGQQNSWIKKEIRNIDELIDYWNNPNSILQA